MRSIYGNRGMTFESLIEYANKRYRAEGRAIIEKQHTLCKPLRNQHGTVYGAKYEIKATVDFMGRYGERPIAFEAKHCTNSPRIDLKRVEDHQCEFLEDWTQEPEAIGFVIVSFDFSDFYLIPWECWRVAKEAHEAEGKGRAMLLAHAEEAAPQRNGWIPTGKASLRKEELPEEWSIKAGGRDGFDYLQTVARIWGIKDG